MITVNDGIPEKINVCKWTNFSNVTKERNIFKLPNNVWPQRTKWILTTTTKSFCCVRKAYISYATSAAVLWCIQQFYRPGKCSRFVISWKNCNKWKPRHRKAINGLIYFSIQQYRIFTLAFANAIILSIKIGQKTSMRFSMDKVISRKVRTNWTVRQLIHAYHGQCQISQGN